MAFASSMDHSVYDFKIYLLIETDVVEKFRSSVFPLAIYAVSLIRLVLRVLYSLFAYIICA